MTLKYWFGVTQGHRKWHRSIEHIGLLSIALSCTIFDLFDVEQVYRRRYESCRTSKPIRDGISKGQHLSANQISSTYLNPRLRYNYFRFVITAVRHIGVPLPLSILTTSPYSACHSALGCQNSSKSVHPQRGYDVKLIFKMAAAAAQFLVTFLSFRMSVSMFICVYQQTKFRSYSSIHS